MNLPNWFRITWWALILVILGTFLGFRVPALSAGTSNSFDMLVLVLFVCLALAPVFSEIKVLGVELKQKIKAVEEKVDAVTTELHNTLSVSSHFNPNITVQAAPPDYKLPELEAQIKATIERELTHMAPRTTSRAKQEAVPAENMEMFELRFNIERELGRIFREQFGGPEDWPNIPLNANTAIQRLVAAEIISAELAKAIREVYAVASAAIHGQLVSEAKLRFVRDVAPDLLDALRAL